MAIARIWSHYRVEVRRCGADLIHAFDARVDARREGNGIMATNSKMKYGVLIAASVIAGMTTFWLSLPLLAIAAGLIARAQEPKGVEAFFANMPYGDKILAFLDKVDAFLAA